MKKTNSIMLVVIVLVFGLLAFKVMSFFGCYVRLGDIDACWKLTV